jgi:hypothetical protein
MYLRLSLEVKPEALMRISNRRFVGTHSHPTLPPCFQGAHPRQLRAWRSLGPEGPGRVEVGP